MSEIRILVAAGDPLARAGLALLLGDQDGCVVVGQAAGDANLLNELDIYQPDVLLWDLGWEPEEALRALAEVVDEMGLPVVALVVDDEAAAPAWAAGARGLLRREAAVPQLLGAITAVAQGLATFDADLADALLPADALALPSPAEKLTPRELEVLQLLAEGLSNRAIAQKLAISQHTVKFHVTAIMGKLGAQSRTAAVVRATRLGLILL